MRLMDGTSKRRDKNQGGSETYTATDFDLMGGGCAQTEEQKATKRRR